MQNNYIVLIFRTIIILIISLAIANISIILFKKSIISEKVFPRSNLRLLPSQYQVYYQDTFNFKSNDTYTALIGDSHVFGIGDGFYDLKSTKYSIAHFLKDKFPDENFISFGLPGAGNIEPYYFYDKMKNSKIHSLKNVNRILYFFYEGNDLEDNIRKEFNLSKFLKNFKSDSYFPLYKICKNLISKISGVSQKKEDFVNTYFLKNIEKKINSPLQSPPFELNENEIEKSLSITFTYLKKFKKFTNEIYLIYIPSPATVLDLKNPIVVQKYFPDRDINNNLSKNEILTANRKIVDKISYFCENNNFTFYNLTPNLIEYSRYNLSYGPIDFKHPRVNVYEYMVEIISDNILSKN